MRRALTQRAVADATITFSRNLWSLLLAPPLVGVNVLGVDPGYRNGCKLCVCDPRGNVRHNRSWSPISSARRYGAAHRGNLPPSFDELPSDAGGCCSGRHRRPVQSPGHSPRGRCGVERDGIVHVQGAGRCRSDSRMGNRLGGRRQRLQRIGAGGRRTPRHGRVSARSRVDCPATARSAR